MSRKRPKNAKQFRRKFKKQTIYQKNYIFRFFVDFWGLSFSAEIF